MACVLRGWDLSSHPLPWEKAGREGKQDGAFFGHSVSLRQGRLGLLPQSCWFGGVRNDFCICVPPPAFNAGTASPTRLGSLVWISVSWSLVSPAESLICMKTVAGGTPALQSCRGYLRVRLVLDAEAYLVHSWAGRARSSLPGIGRHFGSALLLSSSCSDHS